MSAQPEDTARLKSSAGTRVRPVYVLPLVLLTMLSYSHLIGNGFTDAFDDGPYVLHNSKVHGGLTLRGIAWAFTTMHEGNWHPLTWISHMLDWQLYGTNPAGHHLTSLVFHIANTLLLLLLLCRITGCPRRSLFVAALFALHPLHVESVAWVSERKDVLSTFFGLLTILAYARYASRPLARRYMLVVVAFVLSLLSKPMLVSLPILLLLLDYWPLRRTLTTPTGRLLLEKVPLFLLAAASCAVTFVAQAKGGAVIALQTIAPGVRAANAAVSCILYIYKMLWPRALCVFYPHPQNTLPVWMVIGSIVLIAVGFGLAVACARKRPYVTVGWLWYVITLLPVIGLVQVGSQAMADRYSYVPLIGPFIAITWAVADSLAAWSRAVLTAMACIVVISLSVCTFVQVGYWRNSDTLLRHAIAVTRDNGVAHHNLGLVLRDQKRWAEAEEQYRAALRLSPEDPAMLEELEYALCQQGKLDEAEEALQIVLRVRPNSAAACAVLATALQAHGRSAEAVAYYREALSIDSHDAATHYNLGCALSDMQKPADAAREFIEAIGIRPSYAAAHHNLGVAYQDQNRMDLALGEYREAVRISPADPQLHESLALALYDVKDYAGAWSEVRATLDLGGQVNPALIEALRKEAPER